MRTALASEFFVDLAGAHRPCARTAPRRLARLSSVLSRVERLFERNAVHLGLHSPVWLAVIDDRMLMECLQRRPGQVRERRAAAAHEPRLCVARLRSEVRRLRPYHQEDHR